MSIVVRSRIDGEEIVIYDSALEGYEVSKLNVLSEIDGAGSAEIELPQTHPLMDSFGTVFMLYKPTITITEETTSWEELLFRGRAISSKADFWGNRTAVLEGERAFLKDAVLRPGTYTFAGIINAHNAQVDDDRQFNVDANAYPSAEITIDDPITAADAVRKLVDENGGRIAFGGTTDSRTINWTTYNGTCYQPIEYGSNLMDLSTVRLNQNYANRIVPFGKKVNGTRVTISVSGNDYVEDSEAVELYGAIAAAVIYNDIDNAADLETAARRELAKRSSLIDTISLKVLDLHDLISDPEYDSSQARYVSSIRIGDIVPIKYPLLDVDVEMLITQRKYDLLNRKNDNITVGGKTLMISDDLV